MKIIAKARGAGKTTELIKHAAETDCYIVCRDMQEASEIYGHAQKMGLEIRYPMTYTAFTKGQYLSTIKGVLFDNADEFIKQMSRVPVKAITITELERKKCECVSQQDKVKCGFQCSEK